jgi:hypothetical protein
MGHRPPSEESYRSAKHEAEHATPDDRGNGSVLEHPSPGVTNGKSPNGRRPLPPSHYRGDDTGVRRTSRRTPRLPACRATGHAPRRDRHALYTLCHVRSGAGTKAAGPLLPTTLHCSQPARPGKPGASLRPAATAKSPTWRAAPCCLRVRAWRTRDLAQAARAICLPPSQARNCVHHTRTAIRWWNCCG